MKCAIFFAALLCCAFADDAAEAAPSVEVPQQLLETEAKPVETKFISPFVNPYMLNPLLYFGAGMATPYLLGGLMGGAAGGAPGMGAMGMGMGAMGAGAMGMGMAQMGAPMMGGMMPMMAQTDKASTPQAVPDLHAMLNVDAKSKTESKTGFYGGYPGFGYPGFGYPGFGYGYGMPFYGGYGMYPGMWGY